MKKLLTLFIVAITLFSCSSSDDDNANPNLVLEKVVFYRNSPNERHWIITNGLLTKITKADGTLVEQFMYDSQGRIVSDTEYTNGIDGESTTVTYNADNTIASVDGLPYTYNAATRTYAYSYGSNFTISSTVNEDGLAIDFVRGGVGASEYHMTYADGNMTSFRKINDDGTETIKNFYFNGSMEGNPIYNAVLAVAKVKSVTDPGFFAEYNSSRFIPNGFDKGPSDPLYYNYGHIPTMSGELYQVGVEVLNGISPVDFYPYADYYYTAE